MASFDLRKSFVTLLAMVSMICCSATNGSVQLRGTSASHAKGLPVAAPSNTSQPERLLLGSLWDEQCPGVGRCDRLSYSAGGGCQWFGNHGVETGYHCEIPDCSQKPSGQVFGDCYDWHDASGLRWYYTLKVAAEQCPVGRCDRLSWSAGGGCQWFGNHGVETGYHCEIRDCSQKPSGQGFGDCFHWYDGSGLRWYYTLNPSSR